MLPSDDLDASKRVIKQMKALEDRKDGLERTLAEAEEPAALLHPEVGAHYRQQAAELHAALHEETRRRGRTPARFCVRWCNASC